MLLLLDEQRLQNWGKQQQILRDFKGSLIYFVGFVGQIPLFFFHLIRNVRAMKLS